MNAIFPTLLLLLPALLILVAITEVRMENAREATARQRAHLRAMAAFRARTEYADTYSRAA